MARTRLFITSLTKDRELSGLEKDQETVRVEASESLKQKVKLTLWANEICHEPDCRQAGFTNYRMSRSHRDI